VSAVVRLALALLILLSLTSRIQAVLRTAPDLNDAASLVAPLTGLGLATPGPDGDGVITAAAPGCALPVQVAMMDLSGGQDADEPQLLGPAVHPRYVYLGSVSARTDLRAMYALRLKAEIAAMLGLRASGVPPFRLAMVAIPDACPAVAGLDWAVLSPAD
jgi:hypothetical protein